MSHKISFDRSEHAQSLVDGNVAEDIVVLVESESFLVYRDLLMAISEYFRAMFSHQWRENQDSVIKLEGVTSEGFRVCLDYMYGRESEVSEQTYGDLMDAANLLLLNRLVEILENIIIQNLNEKLFFTAEKIAEKYGRETLESKCKEVAYENFLSISMEDEFVDLDISFVIEIIKSESVVMSEVNKLEAGIRWVQHNAEARSGDLIHFLKCIDFRFVPIEKRQQLVHNEPLIKNDVACVTILIRSIIKSLEFEIEKVKPNAIVVFDGISGNLQQFEPKSNLWREMRSPSMMNRKIRSALFSAVAFCDKIYIFMGNKEVFCLKHIQTDATWEQMAGMIEYHGCRPPVVVVKKIFYAVGSQLDCLRECVERFDPETNEWTKLQEKPQTTKLATLLEIRGCIYSFGGKQANIGWVKDVQRFDPTTLEWKKMKPMREAKHAAAGIEFDGKAYIMGGRKGSCLASVDCYDPEMDQWSTLAPMTIPRSWFRVFAIDGFIYTVGGCDYSPDSMEKFDIERRQWTMAPTPHGISIRILNSLELKLD